jgi:hypothetical protein
MIELSWGCWFIPGVGNLNWSLVRIWKNFDISGHTMRKSEGKSPKYRKITGFQFEIGPQNFLFGTVCSCISLMFCGAVR